MASTKKGRSLVIGACGNESASLATTLGAKLAYAPTIGGKRLHPTLGYGLGKAMYQNVTFVAEELDGGDWLESVYSNVCIALGFPYGSFVNPNFFNAGRPHNLIDDNGLSDLIKFLKNSSTDVVIFPYVSCFTRRPKSVDLRNHQVIMAVKSICEHGIDVIYTTPFFRNSSLVHNGSWQTNAFFQAADYALFVEEFNPMGDEFSVCRLLDPPHKSIREKTLFHTAMFNEQDLKERGLE
jgi:hypothetical protein